MKFNWRRFSLGKSLLDNNNCFIVVMGKLDNTKNKLRELVFFKVIRYIKLKPNTFSRRKRFLLVSFIGKKKT